MADQNVIILTSNEAAHNLLAKQGATFSDRPHFIVAQELALQVSKIYTLFYSHWEKQRALHSGNLERGLRGTSWNFSRQMQRAIDAMKEIDMPVEELALNIGIMSDAALDASTEMMMCFLVACITEGHRGWMAKAQDDMDRGVGGGRLPGFEDRLGLPYINVIVEELLRWRPAGAAGVPHFSKVEGNYEGYRIPANSVVIPNHWSITREEAVFGPDVESFVPEQWLGEGFPTVRFGYGRRVCPKRHIARNSLWIFDARLLWAFDIKPGLNKLGEPVEVDTKGTDGLVTKPLPFKARFVPSGDWVREVVTREGDTWGLSPYAKTNVSSIEPSYCLSGSIDLNPDLTILLPHELSDHSSAINRTFVLAH
ncbi:cytochrome P450 [Triangularia setosa]|uniref:Cytochrome P450 n=1 Tax=Triangularia setosa TaxID=2587417 RepID=A0AAN7A609_9PEZI|nr:cytochrome P450 [Podospora setosa]